MGNLCLKSDIRRREGSSDTNVQYRVNGFNELAFGSDITEQTQRNRNVSMRVDLGSDEDVDLNVPVQEKPLFESDIIPVSSNILSFSCEPCNNVVDCIYTKLFHKDGQCMSYGETKCEHKTQFFMLSTLVDNIRYTDTEGVTIHEDCTFNHICASKAGTLYSVYVTSVYQCQIVENKRRTEFISAKLFGTSDTCYGIACFNGGFALLIKAHGNRFGLLSWQIQYTDDKGTVLKYVYKKPDGQRLLDFPSQIVSNYQENLLYIVDETTILVMDVKGYLIKCFHFDAVPTCITADNEGNMYVVCYNNVFQLNKNFDRKRMILKADENSEQISAMTWINPSRALAIISGKWINTYKLVSTHPHTQR